MSSDPSPCATCARLDRRQFLTSASLLSLGAMVTASCGDGVLSGPEISPGFPEETLRLDPRQITALQQVGGRTVVTQGVTTPVLVERVTSGQYRALSLVCPHRGTIVAVEPNGFLCPNHGARFDRDGTWLGGQATADLAPLGVRVNADGTLTIGGAPLPPALALGASSAAFVTTLGGAQPAPRTIAIGNDGGGILSGLQVSLAYGPNQRSGWLSVQLDQASAPAVLTLTAQRGTLTAGTYNATVTVGAPGISNGAQTIAVSLLVQDPAAPAALQLSVGAVAFSSPAGTTPPPQTVQCSNSGGGTLAGLQAQVAYGATGGRWLSVSFDRTSAPAALTLQADLTGLAAGSYTATVTVSATGVASRTIAVVLTVTPQGLVVTLAAWPALANVGGVAGSVGNVSGGPVAVARTGPTSFAAYSMRCPHAGTTINVVNGTSFRCPNHGAQFNSQGVWQPSPQRAEDLTRLTVTYTPGASTLVVS
ncbi:MAG: Rieske 2Fe-2S domain-containing protein [Gemmatimonas sp.]|jgi:Rieske Fe-S protein|uniref:Rieske 2Fe-2S domain-containing protein n=1 Tax=Gemmatimonas sp. TaxID=1962908 RepID=UPI00391F2283|nr:Rieske 2Fe-2S domain-containing protein [Gemmatimonadota bacterium]